MKTTVVVPEGHHVEVHPPVAMPQPGGIPQGGQGMIPTPAIDGAKLAMDSALAPPPKKPKPKAKKTAHKGEQPPAQVAASEDDGE